MNLIKLLSEVTVLLHLPNFDHFKDSRSITYVIINDDIRFEWDTRKSIHNFYKHHLPFEFIINLWSDDKRLIVVTPYQREVRALAICNIEKFWTVIFTIRDKRTRIISIRRSRKYEIGLYYDKINSSDH